jgi:hypothetical protein
MFNTLQYYNKNDENDENKICLFEKHLMHSKKNISILIIQYLL